LTRTHDPSVGAVAEVSCPRPQATVTGKIIIIIIIIQNGKFPTGKWKNK
jgi:hypothetical protein